MACPGNAVVAAILEHSYRLMSIYMVVICPVSPDCTIYMLGVFAIEDSCLIGTCICSLFMTRHNNGGWGWGGWREKETNMIMDKCSLLFSSVTVMGKDQNFLHGIFLCVTSFHAKGLSLGFLNLRTASQPSDIFIIKLVCCRLLASVFQHSQSWSPGLQQQNLAHCIVQYMIWYGY